jgi:DNA-binding GntR family transcriptional regulator
MLANQSTADIIANTLRSEITLGRIPPGCALRQEELAERFSVSRIPIREALRSLEHDGLVQVYPNRGAFVVSLSTDEIREISDLRVLLEGDLIFHAVSRLEDSDLRTIKEAERTARQSAATPGWIEADRAFHRALYAPANRSRQLALSFSLRGELERYQSVHARLPIQRKQWLKDHQDILEACRLRNADAARETLTRHLRGAGEFLAEQAQQDHSTTKANQRKRLA